MEIEDLDEESEVGITSATQKHPADTENQSTTASSEQLELGKTTNGFTIFGEEKEGFKLTKWQQCIRLYACLSLPSNFYQTIDREGLRLPLSGESDDKALVKKRRHRYVIDEYIENYRYRPPVLFIPLLTFVQIVVFICYAVELVGRMETVNALSGVNFNSPFIVDNARRYEIWRFILYPLIHQGVIHFVVTLLANMTLGISLELVHGWWRVALLYSLGTLAGSLMHTVVDRHAFLAGAAGGTYALIGAHGAVVVMNFASMTYPWMTNRVLRVLFSSPSRLVACSLTVLIDTILEIYTRHDKGATDDPVKLSYSHHIMGLLVGIFIGFAMLRSVKRKFYLDVLWYITVAPYLGLIVFCLFWNIFYDDYAHTDWRLCCLFNNV